MVSSVFAGIARLAITDTGAVQSSNCSWDTVRPAPAHHITVHKQAMEQAWLGA